MATSIVNPWFVLSVIIFIILLWGFEYWADTSLKLKQVAGYAFSTVFGIVVISILLSVC